MKWDTKCAAVAAIILLAAWSCSPGSGTGSGGEDQGRRGDLAGADALLEVSAPDTAADLTDVGTDQAVDQVQPFDVEPELVDAQEDTGDGGGEIAPDSADAAGEIDAEPEIVLVLPQPVAKDPYGGLADVPCAEPTGFFTTGECDGRMFLLTPEGNPFFSFGMSAFRFGGPVGEGVGYSPAKLTEAAAFAALGYPGENKQNWWIEQKVATAVEFGFNTIAGWGNSASKLSIGKVPGTYSFGFASGVGSASYVSNPIPAVNSAGFPDVFHADFSAMCLEYAQNRITPEMAADPWNIGYFADNELHWWGQGFWLESAVYTLTDDFFTLPATSAGKISLVQYLGQAWAEDVDGFNDEYDTAITSFDDLLEMTELPYEAGNQAHYEDRMGFVALVAEEYFANVNDALKAVDPAHLNLCVRVASIAPDVVVTAMAKYCDVITFNDYFIKDDQLSIIALGAPAEERWEKWVSLAFESGGAKPFLVTEWGVRGEDSGLPNSTGAGWVVGTQQERLESYQYVMDWLLTREHEGLGYVTGVHWFMHQDQPPTGRWDGENSNYGIVTVRNERYRWLLEGMAALHSGTEVYLAHDEKPSVLPPPEEVTVDLIDSESYQVSWTPVPGAQEYRVSMLSHPAGLENRVILSTETSGKNALVYEDFGLGHLWVAVEALHAEALHAGFSVVGPLPIEPWPGFQKGCPSQSVVLNCESLCGTAFDNLVEFPNEKAGLSFASLDESFATGGDYSLKMEFIPSSLGLTSYDLPGSPDIEVTVSLPEPVLLGAGEKLVFDVLPGFAVGVDQAELPASHFIRLKACGEDGECPLEWPLSELDTEPGVATTASLEATEELEIHSLVFFTNLYEDNLPMEQPLSISVDSLGTE